MTIDSVEEAEVLCLLSAKVIAEACIVKNEQGLVDEEKTKKKMVEGIMQLLKDILKEIS